jgi:hypothetical protein
MRIILLLFLLTAVGPVLADLPVLEVSAADKTAKNVPGIASVDRIVREHNGLTRFNVEHLREEPEKILLKVTGLSGSEYAVYIDKEYRGLKSRSALEEGLQLDLKQIYIPEDQRTYLRLMTPRIRAITHEVYGKKEPESKLLYDRMSSLDRWVDSVIRAERAWKSLYIRLVPFGNRSAGPAPVDTETPEKQREIVETLFFNIDRIRNYVLSEIKDGDLRNRALVALTPVELDLKVDGKLEPGVTVEAAVSFVNRTNLPLSGRLRIDAPVGWEIEPKGDASFTEVAMDKSAEARFVIKIPQETLVTDEAVLPAVDLNIAARDYTMGQKEFRFPKISIRANPKTLVSLPPDTPPPGTRRPGESTRPAVPPTGGTLPFQPEEESASVEAIPPPADE